MRILIWIALLVAVVAAASGQSENGTSAPARSATLPADIYPDSACRGLFDMVEQAVIAR